MRFGKVRITERVRGSTWSRIRRARGETFSVSRAPPSSCSERAVDEMMFEIPSFIFRNRPAAHRHAGLVHGLAVAADQIMPREERLVFRAEPVGAGRGQPVDLAEAGGVEPHAIGDEAAA